VASLPPQAQCEQRLRAFAPHHAGRLVLTTVGATASRKVLQPAGAVVTHAASASPDRVGQTVLRTNEKHIDARGNAVDRRSVVSGTGNRATFAFHQQVLDRPRDVHVSVLYLLPSEAQNTDMRPASQCDAGTER